ncbi:FtsK/SpoIIIE family DNA translocase [Paludisphaera mucosa]|uniref:DNA translocase FtsK 4TM domain-containing protein n=1 Tax=Paludisphaera mucosa TaxID=3030827 RepID=A0ABT6F4G7_9BACT|nr:DNA translocase FtsK [Paludisphaera mucosa]MDG3002314.1 DNA translocase FtsK 4TM domain-containing protein [Paludisphaera mucosa]
MLLRQRLFRSAPGLAFLILNLFLALSLVGYDPADALPGRGRPDAAAATAQLANPCGPVGARLAHLVHQAFGWASWLALGALLALNLLVARARRPADRVAPAVGFLLVLTVAAALIDKFAAGLRPSAPVGPGGYAGAMAVAALESHFGLAGMLLILAAAALFGAALCQEALVSLPAQELSALIPGLLRRRRREPAPIAGVPALADWQPAPQALGNDHAPRAALPRGAVFTEVAARPGPLVQRGPALPPARPPQAQVPAVAHAAHSYPKIDPGSPYQLPPFELLEPAAPPQVQEHEAQIHARAMLLERTLLDFGYQVRVVQIDTGPVITQFEIELEAGLRVSRIAGLADDLAIALAVQTVRIVAPIPGKTTVGIEVPNDRRTMVRLGEVIEGVERTLSKCRIPLFLGKDVKGTPMAFDMADMPHLLIAGRTGTGKSVCLNAMILSILMTRRPDEVKMIMIDPKVVELSQFKKIPHLMHPVVTDMKKAESILAWACDKMDERYGFLARAGVRNISSFNALGPDEILARMQPEDDEEAARIPTFMPYIVIVADEIAELMMTAGKEVEQHIVRLAQKSRAVGMHLILATQKPTVDVVTGLIKGNMPARIAFQVASRSDSRVVLDEMGADKLLGNGDMLFLIPGTSQIVRAQGTYVSDAELNRVTEYLSQYPAEYSREMMQLNVGGPSGKERGSALKERDDLYEPAIEVVIREGRGSSSLLQRALGIGYGRASRLIDFMAEDGIVGEFKSGSAREVLYTWEEWEALKGGAEGGDASGDSNGAAA